MSTTAAPVGREARLAEIIIEIQEADATIANVNRRIQQEGPSFQLMQAQRDALTRWNATLSEYSRLKNA